MWHFDKCRLSRDCAAPFKLRNSKWCSFNSLTLLDYSSHKQRLRSDCAYAQADLKLLLVAHTTLLEIPYRDSNNFGTFITQALKCALLFLENTLLPFLLHSKLPFMQQKSSKFSSLTLFPQIL